MTPLLKPWLKSYLSEKNIDWSGRYPLTHTGAIDEQKTRDAGLPIISGTRPVPVVQRSSEKYRELLEAINHAMAMLIPASPTEAVFELKRLSVWCPMQNRDVRDFKIMLHDALNDLAEYPVDLLQKACSQYRNDSDHRNDFFPRPGRLKELVEHKLQERKTLLYKLERLLAIANEPPKLPPPVTLAEIEEQIKTQAEVSKLLADITHKKPKEITPAEEREQYVCAVEGRIKAKFKSKHLTGQEATELLDSFYVKYPDIFLTTK